MAYFSLRPELYFDQVADVRATNQAMPGKTVIFTIVNDLPVAPNALTSEQYDVTPVSFSDSQISVALAEYGNAIVTSAKLRGTAFVDVDPVVANLIGYNAGVSLDSIARNVLAAGSQVAYSNNGKSGTTGTVTSRSAMGTSDPTINQINSVDIRTARARLRAANVPTFGGSYVGFIHPDIVVDLQSNDTTLAGWRAPHTYSAPSEIWTGDLGQYEGVRWIETPRAPEFINSGTSFTATSATDTMIANYVTGIPDEMNGTVTGSGAASTLAYPEVGSVVISAGTGSGGTAIFSDQNGNAIVSSAASQKLIVTAVQGGNFLVQVNAALYPGIIASCTTGGTITVLGSGSYSVVTGTSPAGTYTGQAPIVGATLAAGTAVFTSGSLTVASVTPSTTTPGTGTFTTTGGGVIGTAGTVTVTANQGQYNVYGTLILGRQSLAKAHALADGNGPLPSIVPGPVTDLLRRHVPLGWYWLGGYSIFRQASVYRLESVSSLSDQNTYLDLQ
jgi:N4-gp56 family major capsid protein